MKIECSVEELKELLNIKTTPTDTKVSIDVKELFPIKGIIEVD